MGWRTAEEHSRLAREARHALEQMKAAQEMAENKAECQREAVWAKEREDQRTLEERARDEEEADALHERLWHKTLFAAHHKRKVKATNGVPYNRVMPRLSVAHPHLEDAEGLDSYHSLVFVVDADEYEPPTYYSFKDIKKRSIGRRLTKLPFTCRVGADLVYHETEKSRVERAKLYGMDSCCTPFATSSSL